MSSLSIARTGLAITIRPRHIISVLALGAVAFLLRATTPFSLKEGLLVWGLALISTAPLGWLLTQWLIPQVESRSVRLTLMGLLGYIASVLAGFFLGVAQVQYLYLPFCGLCLGLCALQIYWKHKAALAQMWTRCVDWVNVAVRGEAGWGVLIIGFVSILVCLPLMSPMEKATSDLYIDYAYIDTYFQTSRAQVLGLGAPAYTNPDQAGAKPTVYPDHHNFWIGQLAEWSQADINRTYFIYVPVLMILFSVLAMYATGKELTQSRWGGYIAAALPYIVFFPNPYDINFDLRNAYNGAGISGAFVQFMELRGNLSYGVAWTIIVALTLILSIFRRYRNTWTEAGLLIVGSILTIGLIRIRPHFLLPVGPLYGLILAGTLIRRRHWQYLLPPLALMLLFGLIYFESSSGHYDQTSSRLVLAYGPFGDYYIQVLPAFAQRFIEALPHFLRPALVAIGYEGLLLIGVWYGVLLIGWAVVAIRQRRRPNLVNLFLIGLLVISLVGASLVIIEARREEAGGAWGFQVLNISPQVAQLLAIMPLYQLLRRLSQWTPLKSLNYKTVGLGLLLACSVVAYRGADATLHDQVNRAYLIPQGELDEYYWIRTVTDPKAVMAAHPDHVVNSKGETIGLTNFLSGMTERPTYMQRAAAYGLDEFGRRRELLERLFNATTADEVNGVLQDTQFDYLIVYQDKTPEYDLGCCMTLVREGALKIYQVNKP